MPVPNTAAKVELSTTASSIAVVTATYVLDVQLDRPRATLSAPDGTIWSDLCVLASVDRVGQADESFGEATWTVEPLGPEQGIDEGVELRLSVASTAWAARVVRVRCTPESVRIAVTVHGAGSIDEVTVLGGRSITAWGASGQFRSGTGFASVFVPTPTEPVQVVRPSSVSAQLGVVGDAEPGRLNAVFSPPPYCFALGRGAARGATSMPAEPWLGAAIVGAVDELTFTTARYDALDGGWLLRLSYEGHTVVDGSWTTPEIVLRPATSAWAALAEYREDLIGRGWAPPNLTTAVEDRPTWWLEPIFCGWGAQCAYAVARQEGGDPESAPPGLIGDGAGGAPDFARQELYDGWLARLAAHDVVPGTVVLDDRWQAQYGLNTVDTEKWPDLRGWIADRHGAGQRVLLWLKAWDPGGLPAELCVVDAAGMAVAADPSNPAYLRLLAAQVAALLSPAGIDADGFKVDFTQRTPSGASLRSWGDQHGGGTWGTAALHALLRTVRDAAKAAKPDALVVTHTPHPSFGDVSDMIRLNDVLENDLDGYSVPVADQMRFRAAVAAAALPQHPVDTDQWPMPSHGEWRDYVAVQGELGVPALYYVESIERTGERVTSADLRAVAAAWHAYRQRAKSDSSSSH